MSIAKIQVAIAATTDTYVKVKAGDLAEACKESGDTRLAVLGQHAADMVKGGKDGPETVMQIHRDVHGKLFAPAPTPAPVADATPAPTPVS